MYDNTLWGWLKLGENLCVEFLEEYTIMHKRGFFYYCIEYFISLLLIIAIINL